MRREVVVLAGGYGSRLRTIVSDVPKPMAIVGGRPFVEYILDRFVDQKVSKFILSVGYKADVIERHFGANYRGVDICYVAESSPLGTGGAVRKAFSYCSEDYVYVVNGDTYLDVDCASMERLVMRYGGPVLAVISVENAARYGVVVLDENGRIKAFKEKISGNEQGVINAGCYLLSRETVLNDFQMSVFSLENDVLPNMIATYPCYASMVDGRFIDIGIPEDYVRSQHILLSDVSSSK